MALIFILPFGPFIVTDDRNRRPLSHSWLLKRKRWSKTQPNYLSLESAQSVQSLSRVRLFVTPWTAERQASLSIINSRSLLRLMSIKSVMPSNHLILCVPFSSRLQSLLGTYRPGEFIFQCPIFLLFHTVHGVLMAGILKWFAILFSSEPHFVRTLYHDPSVVNGPTRAWLIVSLS